MLAGVKSSDITEERPMITKVVISTSLLCAHQKKAVCKPKHGMRLRGLLLQRCLYSEKAMTVYSSQWSVIILEFS